MPTEDITAVDKAVDKAADEATNQLRTTLKAVWAAGGQTQDLLNCAIKLQEALRGQQGADALLSLMSEQAVWKLEAQVKANQEFAEWLQGEFRGFLSEIE